jgi:YaiO family outer membrane protein
MKTMGRKPWIKGMEILVLVLIFSVDLPSAAGRTAQQDVDALFRKARQLGEEGRYGEAKGVCRSILKISPEYHDVRVYLGRLHLWSQDYDAARVELVKVLDQIPDHADALHAVVDAELWSGHPEEALRLCERGLGYHPQDRNFRFKKAQILVNLKRYPESAETLRNLLAMDPDDEESRQLLRHIQSTTQILSFGQTYRLEVPDRREQDLRPWHFFSLEGAAYLDRSTLIGRVNYADRDYGAGGLTGTQIELESWPVFNDRFYAYLNAGYSSDIIFPRTRLGGELYANLPGAFELSAGLRYMDFRGTRVYLYTGTLGKYHGNYWFSFRPWISSDDQGSIFSGLFWMRRYFRTQHEYISVLAGFGATPVELVFLEDIQRYSSFRLGLEAKLPLSKIFFIRGHLRYEREEYLPDVFGNRFVLDLRLEQRIFRKY